MPCAEFVENGNLKKPHTVHGDGVGNQDCGGERDITASVPRLLLQKYFLTPHKLRLQLCRSTEDKMVW